MASPGELVKAVSEATGIPAKTVTVIDRKLAEQGYRAKGGRGLSAASMQPQDAANLIIAATTTTNVVDCVSSLQNYMNLPSKGGQVFHDAPELYGGKSLRRSASNSWELATLNLPTLKQLPASHSFQQALSALIFACEGGHLKNVLEEAERETYDETASPGNFLDIYFEAPLLTARIAITTKGVFESHSYSNHLWQDDDLQLSAHLKSEHGLADLKRNWSISEKTIFLVGDTLATQKEN